MGYGPKEKTVLKDLNIIHIPWELEIRVSRN